MNSNDDLSGFPRPLEYVSNRARIAFLIFVALTLFADQRLAATEISMINKQTDLQVSTPEFSNLSGMQLAEIVMRLDTHEQIFETLSYLSTASDWLLHRGDLILSENWVNDQSVIVDGDVYVEGTYDDAFGSGHLVVLGNLQAEHVLNSGLLAITDGLSVSGLIYAYYNDFVFEVDGEIRARALLVSDKLTRFDSQRMKVKLFQDSASGIDIAKILHAFRPELLVPAIQDLYGEDYVDTLPGFDDCRQHALNQLPIFRQAGEAIPNPESLIEANQDDIAEARLISLANENQLTAAVIAARPGLSENLQAHLYGLGQAMVTQHLARNPELSPELLDAIERLGDAGVREDVATNPHATSRTLDQLASDSDPAVRAKAAMAEALSESAIELLASDTNPVVVEALVGSPHAAYRLSDSRLGSLVEGGSTQVLTLLAGYDGLLGEKHLTQIAQRGEQDAKRAVAENLAHQARGYFEQNMADSTRERLARSLLKQNDPAVAVYAVQACPVELQLEIGRQLLQTADENSVEHYLLADLAEHTTSQALMWEILGSEQGELLQALAANLALPEKVQEAVLGHESVQFTRSQSDVSLLESVPDDSGQLIDALVANPNATEKTLLSIADLCRLLEGNSDFCESILQRRNLKASLLRRLNDVPDTSYRESVALTAMQSQAADRDLLEQAIALWFEDDPIAKSLQRLRDVDDDSWWDSLSQSEHPELQAIAAGNKHTARSTLLRMAEKSGPQIAPFIVKNPNFPLSHPLCNEYPGSMIENPALSNDDLDALIQRGRSSNATWLEDAASLRRTRTLRAWAIQ